MKKLIAISLMIVSIVLLWGGCTKPDNDESLLYGLVTDFDTGEPVKNANIQLRPSGETTLTGSDGTYEFQNLPEGEYKITVSKSEYTDLVDNYPIVLKKGKRIRRDLQIEKLPTWIRITDMMGNDLPCLDFGTNENFKAFNVFNNGTVAVHDCHFDYDPTCEWISNVSPIPDQILSGHNVTITIQIDRTKLKSGVNSINSYFRTENGSNLLVIKATK